MTYTDVLLPFFLLSFTHTHTAKTPKQNPLLSANATWRHMWHVQTVAGGRQRALRFFLSFFFFLHREGWVESFCTQLHRSKFVGWFLSRCIDPPCHLELVYWHIESGPLDLVPLNYDIHMMSRCSSPVAVHFTCLFGPPPPNFLVLSRSLHHLPRACHLLLTFPSDRWHCRNRAISTHVILFLRTDLLLFFCKWEVVVQQMDFQFASYGHFFFLGSM